MLMNADEVAKAFTELRNEGKVKHFGVSNFMIEEFKLLQSRLDFPLVTNQIEYSLFNHQHQENGNLDFLQRKRIHPMAWSPLAQGRIFTEQSERGNRLREVLWEIANACGIDDIGQIALAWIFKHPAGFATVVGSGNLERIKSYPKSLKIDLSREEWFKLWTAAHGYEIP
jgi:predicted oxidoreductase